ncbi:MAG: glycosyltransferase family 87 protein [Anaerolineae bacterium]
MNVKLPSKATVEQVGILALFWLLTVTSLSWLTAVVPGKSGWDFGIYLTAYAKAAAGRDPYLPFHIGSGFLNHPFLLSVAAPFAWLPDSTGRVLAWATAVFLAWIGAILAMLRLAAHVYGPLSRRRQGFILLLFLGFAPIVEALYVGQISPVVALLLCLCLLLAVEGREALSGLSLALAILFKTSPVLLLVYFTAIRRWRVVVSTAVSLFVLSGVSAVQFSPHSLADFAAILPRLGLQMHASPFNLSGASLVSRALIDLNWQNLLLPLRQAHILLVLAATLFLFRIGLRLSPHFDQQHFWLFAAFLALMVAASPLVWYHHLLFLLLPLAGLVLHPSRVVAASGLGLTLLIQLERPFDAAVGMIALPVLLAQAAVLGASLTLCISKGQANGK